MSNDTSMEQRIVICAPTGQDAALTGKVFASVGLQSIICCDVARVIEAMPDGVGALLLVEEAVSGHAMNALVEYVASQPTWSDLPILLLTRSGADSLDVQRAVKHLGNVTLLERPVRTIALIAATRAVIRARNRQYQVRDADQRKDEFLATLAHELRNPLAPIQTAMGILAHVHPDSARVTQVREVVNRQVTHLTRLVDDLLDVARITRGKVVLKTEPISLRAVINHAVEISSSIMESKKHTLAIQGPAGEHTLQADHARLVQSVANLLVNAAKYTPDGGHIVLRTSVEGEQVTFSIRDNGIGLAKDSLTRIFELFAQTPVAGEAPTGLGIGLSLARQFAEMHGGSLHAESDGMGCGSQFVLTLPVVVVDAGETPKPAADQVRMPVTPAGKKILVVDDNVDAADTLEALLDMDGFKVTIAYNGIAAVAAAASVLPDVVVMDIGMPGMDGYDAAREIRQQPGGKDVVLIALTGWGQMTDKQRARHAGFDHHLVKPVDYQRLLSCLQTGSPSS
ncbi:response regulator [Polaromonas sp.]|uniref:hybrid sensor histidine kinase/response regulator n=1 Tax=Polaromonas sp. TaxID=1869339 RepID=UPI002C249276|nr:response regulator [Polaromonas sp.]HQS33723.1 response regulator [Polaromonas sp.]HQS92984.1 response regulator [Polaromonas sp.]